MKLSLDSSLQTARRATVGRSALGWIALLCLLGSSVFWFVLFTDLLTPPTLLSPQAVQAFLMVVAYALILPLFWSMLLPTSPAGRLLQKQSWAMPGSIAVVAAALFLTYYAGSILLGWWRVQPTIRDTGSALFLTITSLIAAVLVPALSWCVVTPEQWIAQIEQARHVKRIEHAMRMEEAALRAAYARAVSLLNADLTNLTIAQRRELAGILGGFARTQQHALQSIAASWKDMYGVEAQLATIPDQELLAGYKEVAHLLTDGVAAVAPVLDYVDDVLADEHAERAADEQDTLEYVKSSLARSHQAAARAGSTPAVWVGPATPAPPADAPSRTSRPVTLDLMPLQGWDTDAIPVPPATPPPTPTPASPPRSAATRRDPPWPIEYAAARSHLTGTWSARQLGQVIGKHERTARDRIAAWEEYGLVAREQGSKNSYYFTEQQEG